MGKEEEEKKGSGSGSPPAIKCGRADAMVAVGWHEALRTVVDAAEKGDCKDKKGESLGKCLCQKAGDKYVPYIAGYIKMCPSWKTTLEGAEADLKKFREAET